MFENDSICRCCGGRAIFFQQGYLLDNKVSYFDCTVCGYVQTENPYWLDRAYSDAINESDTGIMVRNQANSRIVLATMMLLGRLDGVLVDCAGGYGVLVRLLRDLGVNALWSDRYCNNILAKGFEHTNENADLVTAFEAFEHFLNPVEELHKFLEIAPNVLLSTEIIPSPAPPHDSWWYYGREHGQHIGFFRMATLRKMASDCNKYLYSIGNSYHLISDKPINRNLWRILIRLDKVSPFYLGQKLASKTWSDHLQIATRVKY